jgi:hypothetical protein
MKIYHKSMLAAVATLALWLAAFTAPASANGIIYTFDKDCCGVTSADTVTVSDIDANEIRVTVSFADTPGIGFFSNAGNGGGQVLWFNINPSLLSGSGLSVLPASDFTLPTDFTRSRPVEWCKSSVAIVISDRDGRVVMRPLLAA